MVLRWILCGPASSSAFIWFCLLEFAYVCYLPVSTLRLPLFRFLYCLPESALRLPIFGSLCYLPESSIRLPLFGSVCLNLHMASLRRLRSDAVTKVLTPSLASSDGVAINPDAVSRHCTHSLKDTLCKAAILNGGDSWRGFGWLVLGFLGDDKIISEDFALHYKEKGNSFPGDMSPGIVFDFEEMRRLEATGTYTDDEINRLARGGKQRGHIPGVLPARAITSPKFESGGASRSVGCGDDEESADDQEDEDGDGDS
ncbi:hypothetical protein Tco_0004769 [Tanacetum coccineum]